MVNYHIQEGWIDHDLTFRTRKAGNSEKEYAIGTLCWLTGSKENRKRHKMTLFFEDTAQHLMLTAAKTMKLAEHSHVIISGTLRSPAEEKQEDGTWKKPADASMNVESISFAPNVGGGSNSNKTGSAAEEEKTENFAPSIPDLPDGFKEIKVEAGDLPF